MSNKQRVLIVEDDPIIAEDLQASLNEFGYDALEPVENAADAMKVIRSYKPDICLLDVHLGNEIDGIQIASMINESLKLPIVFLTAFNDRATIERIKATNPAGYLVKPVDERNLQTTIEMALHKFYQTESEQPSPVNAFRSDSIFVKIKERLVNVPFDDILFFEAYDNYVFLHTSNQKSILSSSMKAVEEKLPASMFFRVHRSYIVNLGKIEGISLNHLLIGKAKIPIGKTYRSKLMGLIDLL